MTRKSVLIGFVAVLGVVGLLAVAGFPATAGGAEDTATVAELTSQIDDQTKATARAMRLSNSPWVPRTAGLGAGLAVGLVGGGLAAYVTRGGNG